MHLKQLSWMAGVSGVASNNLLEHDPINHGRQLQAGLLPPSVGCIAGGGKTVDECCPDGADKDDGACTLLFCVELDDFSVKDSCKCSQFNEACGQLAFAFPLVAGMGDMCAQAQTCCKEGVASNGDFNACVGTALANGLEIPNVSMLGILLGGPPVADADASVGAAAETTTAPTTPNTAAGVEAAAAATTAATEATGTEAAGTAEATGDTNTTGDADTTPTGAEAPSDAFKHATRAWVPLVGSFAALLLA